MSVRLYEMDQFIGLQLDQDWSDEYENPYEAAEEGILECTQEQLSRIYQQIAQFFEVVPVESERRRHFELNGAFPATGNAFDVWLLAVRRRIGLALAGINNEPLSAPSDFYGTHHAT